MWTRLLLIRKRNRLKKHWKIRKKYLQCPKICYIIAFALRQTKRERTIENARLAQLAEHLTLNQGVQGSNP